MQAQSIHTNSMRPMLAFIRAQFIGQLRNWRMSSTTLLAPLILLIMFTVAGGSESAALVPFVVGYTVMFSGQTLAQILITWRNKHVFKRILATPFPMSQLIIATVLTQLVLFLLQALLVMIASYLVHDLIIDVVSLFAIIGILILGTTPFLSFGALIAAFVNRTEVANIIYSLTIIPMVFLGGSLFEVPGMGELGRFLPSNALTVLLDPYFGFGEPQDIIFNSAVLGTYSVVLTLLASLAFRTEA